MSNINLIGIIIYVISIILAITFTLINKATETSKYTQSDKILFCFIPVLNTYYCLFVINDLIFNKDI